MAGRVRDPIRIAVVQPHCAPYDVARNAAAHAAAVREADARVVVFPELSLTGYELDAETITTGDPRLAPIAAACAEMGATALAGAPIAGADGREYIAMLAIDGTAATVAYRKIWLGGAEPDRFTPGDVPAVLDVDGWRLGLAICKDTGVAQHASDTAALGIDGYIAGVVEDPDVQAQRAARIATAYRVWVAIANADGWSGIWAPGGTCAGQAAVDKGAIVRRCLEDQALRR
jgi:predicted amidohydrolase